MTDEEMHKEVAYIDALPPAQRKIYLHEVEKARGLVVAMRLKAALIALWQASR
jgi:hypothetical protein